jgi:ABC-type multidrug transport system ATPase subunit
VSPTVNEYAIKDFTPEVLWKIVTTEKSTIRLGQVAIVGLPGVGKTTMLNALLQKVIGSKNSIKPKGEPNYVEFYELMMQKNPLTGE